jgi:hypothetical protein
MLHFNQQVLTREHAQPFLRPFHYTHAAAIEIVIESKICHLFDPIEAIEVDMI